MSYKKLILLMLIGIVCSVSVVSAADINDSLVATGLDDNPVMDNDLPNDNQTNVTRGTVLYSQFSKDIQNSNPGGAIYYNGNVTLNPGFINHEGDGGAICNKTSNHYETFY